MFSKRQKSKGSREGDAKSLEHQMLVQALAWRIPGMTYAFNKHTQMDTKESETNTTQLDTKESETNATQLDTKESEANCTHMNTNTTSKQQTLLNTNILRKGHFQSACSFTYSFILLKFLLISFSSTVSAALSIGARDLIAL